MAQYDIYPNPGSKSVDIPFLLAIQNDHLTSRTGASVVIPLRANMQPIDILAPLVDVPGYGALVLSSDEIFAIDQSRLRNAYAKLGVIDRAKIKPAIDKLIGDY